MSDGLSILDDFQNCRDAKKYSSEKMLENNELVTKVYFKKRENVDKTLKELKYDYRNQI